MAAPGEKDRLRHSLEAHHDILHDLTNIRDSATWVRDNYHDIVVIPVPKVNDNDILLRGLLLDALLILYRRCFIGGQRGGIDMSRKEEVLGPLLKLHDDGLIARANKLTAHAVSAGAATTIRVQGGKALPSTFRAGHNKFDFENLIAATECWIPFVEAEIDCFTGEFEVLLEPEDEQDNNVFVAPWGSDVDIQALRTGRPAARTKRQLAKDDNQSG